MNTEHEPAARPGWHAHSRPQSFLRRQEPGPGSCLRLAMQTTLALATPEPLPMAAPLDVGIWTDAATWYETYHMLCMLRRHTEPRTERRRSYDEAVRRHLLDLDSPNARALLRRDANRVAMGRLRAIVTSGLACRLLAEVDRQSIFSFLIARLHALTT